MMQLDLRGSRAPLICLLALLAASFVRPGGAEAQWRWDDVERQVVIPDVHGAFDAFAELLKATGVVDENLDWIGGETHLVSLGDLLDRGPDSRKAMDLLMRLEQQAPEAGGRVHVILGNHELLVLMGDLRYVSAGEYAAFAAEEPQAERERAFEWFLARAPAGTDPDLAREAFQGAYPEGFFAFRAGFASDGRYGRWLLGLPASVVINETAYVHAGLPEFVARMSLEDLNDRSSADLGAYVRAWEELVEAGYLPRYERGDPSDLATRALLAADPSRCVGERAELCARFGITRDSRAPVDGARVAALEHFLDLGDAPVLSSDGPMWYRGSVYCKPILEEPVLDAALAGLRADRVVVGHTPTFDRRVHSLYDGRLTMTDTGMLVAYYQGRPAALVIEDGETTVHYLAPNERTVPLTGGQRISGSLNRAGVLRALTEGDVTVYDRPRGGPWRAQVQSEGEVVEALFYPDDDGELEQAAYVLDELMGLDLVPPTVARRIEGEDGALQLWYPDAISENQRVANQLGIGGWCSTDAQFSLMSLFDFLTFNPGRSADNLLYRRSLWSVHLTDHGRAFGRDRLNPQQVADLELAPGAVAALRALDEDTLEEAMDGLLDGRRIRALLERRDVILSATGAR